MCLDNLGLALYDYLAAPVWGFPQGLVLVVLFFLVLLVDMINLVLLSYHLLLQLLHLYPSVACWVVFVFVISSDVAARFGQHTSVLHSVDIPPFCYGALVEALIVHCSMDN